MSIFYPMIMENSNRIIVEDFYAYVTDIKSCFNNTLQIHFSENNMFVEDKEFLNFINVDSIPNKLNMVFYEVETSDDLEVSETTTAIDLYTQVTKIIFGEKEGFLKKTTQDMQAKKLLH